MTQAFRAFPTSAWFKENPWHTQEVMLWQIHDAGSFYWINTEAFLKEKTFFCKNGGATILPSTQVQDIDNDADWKLAELKHQFINE